MIKNYTYLKEKYAAVIRKEQRQFNTLSMARLATLLMALFAGYFYFSDNLSYWLVTAGVAFAAFLLFVKIHQRVSFRLKLAKQCRDINDKEIDFVENNTLYYNNGGQFTDQKHPYTFDLDIFGKNSLFQYINRTGTSMGLQNLAEAFTCRLPNTSITAHQQAVKELAEDVEWRQTFLALAQLSKDNSAYKNLSDWVGRKPDSIGITANIASYVIPAFMLFCFTGYAFFNLPTFTYIQLAFVLNLLVAAPTLKKIHRENSRFDKVETTIKSYALLLKKIETKSAEADYFKSLQTILQKDAETAGNALKTIGKLFGQMNTIANLLVLIVLNGFFQYHVHVYRATLKWKTTYAPYLLQWLRVIGDVEKLSSLANLYFNNKEFAFPQLNENHMIQFEALGHPLIEAGKRVCNNISFHHRHFMILTGSNMSGKSTFLRSLGVNMVLASMGSAVCAKSAQIHPMPVFVSMRLSDSLSEGASYFFAEVSRLQFIMQHTEKEKCVVLLDEILRGTNSDDKRAGTIGVIKKLVENKTIGAIATHDIEVCRLADEYPGKLMNKRFEVNIFNDELHFDYLLLDGVCQNKSATFLMKKMHIIEKTE